MVLFDIAKIKINNTTNRRVTISQYIYAMNARQTLKTVIHNDMCDRHDLLNENRRCGNRNEATAYF